MSKNCVILYVPPRGKFHPDAVLENLKRNPPKNDLITFSENAEFNPTLKLKISPELPQLVNLPRTNSHPPCGVNNLIFILGFCFAWKLNFDHFIYLEEDVRCKNPPDGHWDQVIFDQFFADPRHLIAGGSMVLWNICNHDLDTARRGNELLAKWNVNRNGNQKERNLQIPFYGARASSDGTGACVLVNGAGGVYSVDGLRMLLPEITNPDDNMAKISLAMKMGNTPFDFFLGSRIWEKFHADAFDVVGHLPCIFSSYGSVLSSEDERIAMLRSGEVVLCHQIKNGSIIE